MKLVTVEKLDGWMVCLEAELAEIDRPEST